MERDDLIRKIDALFAKAESTDFEEEAEALYAKAQELMTRHAIDEALLGKGKFDATIVKDLVEVHNPYQLDKLSIFQSIAEASDVKLLLHTQRRYGETRKFAYLIGAKSDVENVKHTWESVQVQLLRALGRAKRNKPANVHGKVFVGSFLRGYATGLAEKLQAAKVKATAEATVDHGSSVALVLVSKKDAVDKFVKQEFPRLRTQHRSVSHNAAAYGAGVSAGSQADTGQRGVAGARGVLV